MTADEQARLDAAERLADMLVAGERYGIKAVTPRPTPNHWQPKPADAASKRWTAKRGEK